MTRRRRLVVAVESVPPSGETLLALAGMLEVRLDEIVGLFVEEADLLRLAELPFAAEVMRSSGAEREIHRAGLERALRAKARSVRAAFEQAAERLRIPTTFRVARGGLMEELLREAEEAEILVLGVPRTIRALHAVAVRAPRSVAYVQRGWDKGRRVAVFCNATPGSAAALNAAVRLAERERLPLTVLRPPGVSIDRGPADEIREVPAGDGEAIAAAARSVDARYLVLPGDHACTSAESIPRILNRLRGSLIVVRGGRDAED